MRRIEPFDVNPFLMFIQRSVLNPVDVAKVAPHVVMIRIHLHHPPEAVPARQS